MLLFLLEEVKLCTVQIQNISLNQTIVLSDQLVPSISKDFVTVLSANRTVNNLRTFAKKFSNIDFFLKLSPL